MSGFGSSYMDLCGTDDNAAALHVAYAPSGECRFGPVYAEVADGGVLPSRKLWHALHEVDSYLSGQSAWLVNYAERYRAGLRVGTSVTEGTANFLVNRRMNKSQQMRWSRRGADLLLRVRCAVYNGTLRSGVGRRFQPGSNRGPVFAIAA
jgi:hypothetical protein